jgi:hypothetical protein
MHACLLLAACFTWIKGPLLCFEIAETRLLLLLNLRQDKGKGKELTSFWKSKEGAAPVELIEFVLSLPPRVMPFSRRVSLFQHPAEECASRNAWWMDGVVQAGEDQGLLSELRETCFEC